MVNQFFGALRVAAVLVLVVVAFVSVFLAALLPFTVREARPSLWVIVYATRLFNFIFNVRVHCSDVDRLRRHQGFLFLNHLSFLEPLALLSLMPVRFLAAVELQERPVIGWMAEQIGTIFVAREDPASRRAARRTIANIMSRSSYPSVVVFPEGKLGLGDRINPFHYGIFETARQHQISYLLCALWFNRPDVAIWQGARGERMTAALWRLATFPGPLVVELTPLETVHPTPADDARFLATAAQHSIADALDLPAAPSEDN